ncbi:energy transducer TonB [Roseateles sp. DC23W]|uniref:Energy transducer TonB n=1 Tax=Pelomonas dachongensis TaxID=3299029 RepID=A0ABW7EUV2_9BURK
MPSGSTTLRNVITLALALTTAAAHAQFVSGPVVSPATKERCVSPTEAGCEDGFVRITWPIAIGGTCRRPAFVRDLLPAGFKARTIVDIAVDKDGAVTDVKLLIPSGTSALDNALVAAAKTCRFQPGTRGGVPAALTTSWVEVWERTPSAPQMTRVLQPPTSAPSHPASSSQGE